MSDWPKYNPERHRQGICAACMASCWAAQPCRCCETARANAAEAECNALSARLIETVPASYVAMKERALRAEAALTAVMEMHRPVSICPEADGEWFVDECPCGDLSLHYEVCESCCVEFGDCRTETCADCHDHGPGKPICPTIAALDGAA